MHESEITKAFNKIIQGDWNWPYDHEDAGHAKQGEAQHIMLYADGHTAEFVSLNLGNAEMDEPSSPWKYA